jgi:type II secretory pathway pseudopilin PulG
MRQQQSGYGLLEILVGAAVVSALTVIASFGAVAAYRSAQHEQVVTRLIALADTLRADQPRGLGGFPAGTEAIERVIARNALPPGIDAVPGIPGELVLEGLGRVRVDVPSAGGRGLEAVIELRFAEPAADASDVCPQVAKGLQNRGVFWTSSGQEPATLIRVPPNQNAPAFLSLCQSRTPTLRWHVR